MTDQWLRERIEAALSGHFRREVSVGRLNRRACEYCASFAVEEIAVTLSDGTSLELIYKDLGRGSMLETARAVKPDFLIDSRREIEVYRTILAPAGVDTAPYYGAIECPHEKRHGILLGRVVGRHLWQEGEFAAWEEAARWLARLHHGPAARAAAGCASLIRYDRAFHRTWIERACRFVCQNPSRSRSDCDAIKSLASRYDRVIDHLSGLPRTFIHGDYHASNILCADRSGDQRWRILPIDWEMAAWGPAQIDLAALTAGNWAQDQRERMITAYWDALPSDVRDSRPPDALNQAVEYCRLHWAIRWLGWAARWSPPRAQARDWLAEALAAARRVGL